MTNPNKFKILAGLVMFWLLAVQPCSGATSLVLVPNRTGTYTVPNRPEFQTLGSFRIEARFQSFGVCSGNYSNIWDFGPFAVRCFLDGSRSIIITDGPTSRGIIIPTDGRSDFVIRIQRNSPQGLLRGEIWNADSTGYAFYSVDQITSTPQDVTGSKQVGGTTTDLKLALSGGTRAL